MQRSLSLLQWRHGDRRRKSAVSGKPASGTKHRIADCIERFDAAPGKVTGLLVLSGTQVRRAALTDLSTGEIDCTAQGTL